MIPLRSSITELKKIELIDGDIFENTRQDIGESGQALSTDLDILTAPLELCVWDDICLFGNLLIDALNELRPSLSVILVIA